MLKQIRSKQQPLGSMMIAFMLTWQVGQPLQAATFYWDADANATGNVNTGANLGGTGTWDTTTANWWDGAAGTDQVWPNTNADQAIFSGAFPSLGIPSASTVTLSSGVIANKLTFVRSGYTLTGGTLTLDGAAPTLQVNLGESATINSQILGTAGLTKTGSGTLRLTNATNSYTGATTINDGIVSITSGGALGADTSSIVINGSTTRGFGGGSLMLEGGYSTGVTLSRGLTLQSVGLPATGAAVISVGNNTITGAVTNGSALVNTVVSSAGGRLTLGDVTLGGAAGTIFMSFGTTNALGTGSYAITGALASTAAGLGTIGKTGAGTLFLTPSSAAGYSGIFQISAGSIRVTDTAALGTSAATNAIDLNGGLLELRTDTPTFASAKRINLNNGSGATDLLLDRGIGGTGLNQTVTFANFDYDAAETMVINTRNGYGGTFTAATAVGAGAGDTTLTNNGNGLVTYGGTLWGNSDTTARTLTVNGTGNTTISGSITATGANHLLVKSGTGTAIIQGTASTYLGATTISGGALTVTDFRTLNAHSTGTNTSAINIGSTTTAGILSIGTATAATAAGLTLLTGKAINLSGTTGGATINASQSGNPVIIGSVTATGAGAKSLTLGGTSASTVENIISGAIPDGATATVTSLVKADTNMWALSGTNTYTGSTTITGGTLRLKANAATTSTVVGEAVGNTVVFNANATTATAGGTLELVGFSGSATTETLGALTPTAGAATVKLTANSVSPSATNLTFTSLGATTGASSVNFSTTGGSSGVVTLTGQVATTATTLPGTANFQGHLYVNGADFAAINASAQVIQPVYGTTTGFVNAASSLTASSHNLLTGSFTMASATTVSSLKATTQTLTLGAGLTVSLGAILQSGGTATIQSDSATARTIVGSAAGVNVAIRVDGASDVLNLGALNAPVNISSTTTAGFTKNGAGTLVINGVNAQTGTTTINEGTVKLGVNTARLSGANAALVIRQGATLDLNGQSSGVAIGALDGAGTITNSSATAATLIVGNATTGAGTFAGIIQDGAGVMNVTKTGTTGAPTWSGLNTYTGVTTIGTSISTGFVVSVPTLANIGTASGIGRGTSTSDATNAASLVFGGSATTGINYTGTTSVSIDRLFTLNSGTAGGGAQIANSSANNSTLIFNKTNAIAFAAGATVAQTLTLGGASTGDNQINNQIVDNGALATSVSKIGAGTWILGNGSNSYTGATTVSAGILQAATGATLPTASNLVLAGGVFQSSGALNRTLGTGADQLNWTANASGGFASSGSKLTVNLGSSPTWGSTANFLGTGNLVLSSASALGEVELASGFAISQGVTTSLNATTTAGSATVNLTSGTTASLTVGQVISGNANIPANATIATIVSSTQFTLNSGTGVTAATGVATTFAAGGVRQIQVDDNANTFADLATITGVISGTGNLTKLGTGTLQLFGANTYSGVTAVTSASTLVVNSLGNSASPGVGTSLGTSTNANLSTNALTLGNGGTTAGILQYVGPGETSDRMIRLNTTTGSTQIHADGAGPLVLTNVLNDMAAGNKTLFLRGANTQGNMITSVLADNTAGTNTLGITADTSATWILSGANTYTGSTDLTGGALGAGNDAAFGTGSLRVRNGSLFAYGADRTLNNPLADTSTTTAITSTFIGDYSLTLNGAWTHTNTTAGQTITNSIATGKTLTLGGDLSFNAITAARTVTFNGAGDTIVNGSFTTSTAFNINVTYSGTGSLTLGGTASQLGNVTLSSGTLKLSNNNVITDGATAGNMTISPAAGVTAKFDLNGKSETINGLTASAGPATSSTIIDNSSASPASLTFGANDQTVTIGGGGGAYTISNTGGGALSITKTGTTSLTIPSSVTLNYTGTTSVTGGTMTIAAPLNGTSGLSSTGTGSNLNVTGGITTPSAITSITVGGGAILGVQDGVGTPFTVSTLNLGVGSGVATLSLELGTTSDTITSTSAAIVANTIRFNLSGISGLDDNTAYNLLVAPSGLGTLSNYLLGSQPGGFSGGSLSMISDTNVLYTTGAAILGNLYWNNTQANGSWAYNNSGATNFTTDLAGTTDGTFTPGPGTTVIFGSTNTTTLSGTTFTTTLDSNFSVAGLQFTSNPSGVTAWTINAGTPSTSVLTVKASGITVGANAGVITINPSVSLGTNQTWNVDGTGANGSSLTVPSVITGVSKALTKAGAGTLNLSGVNTFSGGLVIQGGAVIATVTNRALGGATGAGTVTLGDTAGGGAASLLVGTTGLTYANPIVLATGATGPLTIGNTADIAAMTFSGGITGTNNFTIANNSATAAARTVTFSTAAINNSGSVTNTGTSTGTTTISGGIGSNVTEIIENSTTSALTISTTALNVNSTGTTLRNSSGTKVLTLSAATQGTGNLILKNDSITANGVTVSGGVNNAGTITNSGTGLNATSGVTISGIIGPNVTGVIQDSANSSLLLTGANTFTSGITIKNGILEAATSAAALGAAGNVITLGDTSGSANAALRFQSNIVPYNNTPVNVVAGSSGTLSILGSRTTGVNTFPGAITLANNLTIGGGDVGATTAALTLTGGVTGTGNLDINYSATALTGAVTFSTGALNMIGSITNRGSTTGATVISSVIGSNVTGVTQNSATSGLTLSGANTFTGGVTLTLGTLNINNATALGNGGTFVITAGTINNSSGAAITNSNVNALTINGDFTFTGSNALDLGTGAVSLGTTAGTARTITTTASTLTLGGVISNGTTANVLSKAGAGTLALGGANTYSGGTTLAAGTLMLGDKSAIGTGTLAVTGSSTLQASTNLTGANKVANALSLGAFTLTFSGGQSLEIAGAGTFTGAATLNASGTSGATITYSGAIDAGGNSVTLGGTGSGIITGGITQTGTAADLNVNAGTWTLSGTTNTIADDVINTGATVVLNLNSTGVLTGLSGTSNGLYARTGATINLNAAEAYGSGLDFIILGDTTTGGATLNTNTFNITTPRLDVGQAPNGWTGAVVGTGTVTVGTNINLYQGTVSAGLAGAGAVLKAFGGTFTLSGDNSGLTGTTAAQVASGNLILDYTTSNTTKLRAATGLDMRGGILTLNGNASAATTQTVASFTLASGGANKIDVNSNGFATTLNLGAITRGALANDGTIRFELPVAGAITTTTTNTNGILGGYATVMDAAGVTNFAANDGANNIVAVTSTTQDSPLLWAAGQNITDSAGISGSRQFMSINSLRFNANTASAVTVSSGGFFNLASGGLLMTDAAATGAHAISGGTLTSGNGELTFTQDSTAQGLTVSSKIAGNSGVTKAGLGTLTLSGNNNYTGATDIQAGVLVASGGNAIGDSSTVTLSDDQVSTFQITSNETIGNLATGGNSTTGFLLGTVAVGSNILTINQTTNGTYGGVFTGSGGIVRNGTSGVGNLLLTGASGSGFTGTLTVNASLVYLEGLGAMDASSITINKGGSFLISNNGITRTSARLLDTASIILNSADGSWNTETRPSGLAVRTDQAATTSETIGVLAFASGASYFRGDASGTTGIAGILTNNFIRANNATLGARGRALGGSTGDRNQLRISDATNQTAFIAALIGGAGAAGTKNISIVPWAFGETTAGTLADANMGNSLVTYVSGTGIRPLDLTTEYNTFGGAPTATDNIRESLGADLTGVAGTTINALVLNNSNTTAGTINVTGTGAGQTLAVTSGTMLFTATAAVTGTPAMGIALAGFANGITVGGTNEYVVFVQNPTSAAAGGVVTATISSQLSSSADITKSGRGTLILNQANTAGGGTKKTTLNEGALEITSLSNIGGVTGSLVFAGGTLRLGAGFTDDISQRTVSFLLGGGTIDTNGINLSLANAFGTGAGGFTKADSNATPGNLTLSGASGIAGYTGMTTISGGRLILGSGVDNRLSTAGTLSLSGTGGLQLGNGTGASNQTVSELTSASATSLILGGDAALSTLTVNQSTSTTYAGLIGGAGTNENNIALVKTGSGSLTLGTVANTFTGGLTIKAGTVTGGNNNNTFGADANVITLGDTSGSADATLNVVNTGTYANAITVASGSSGALTLLGGNTTGAPTLTGAITLNNNLIIAKQGTTGAFTLSGGITGTGNVVIGNAGTTGAIQLTTMDVNHAGSITNSGYATATTLISANIGSSVTDITQNSATSALTLSGTNIAYGGATNVTNGTLNITGDAANSSRSRTTLTVAGGATLNTNNNAGQIVNFSGAINLGAGSGATTLGLDIGSLTNFDQFASSAAATTANAVLLNLTGIGGITDGDYDLLTATGGLNTASYSLGSFVNGGGFSYSLSAAPTFVRLTSTALSGAIYWGGALGTQTSWSAFSGVNSNFATNLAGTNANGTPGTNSNVIFTTSTQAGTSLATTLDGSFSIRDLTFNNQTGTGPLASISIAPGTGGTLTLTPTGTDGINVQTGSPASITISAPLVLGASQTWTVADVATNLVVSGSITGIANLTKTGAGIVTLSGTNLATYVGTTTVNGGVLRAGAATSFNATSAHTIGAAGTLRLNGLGNTIGSLSGVAGAIVENGAASGNIVLTVGDSTSTTFAGTIQNGLAATLGITKVGTGTLTLSGTNTYTGSTLVSAGVLALSGSTTMGAGSITVGNNVAGSRARLQIGTGASLSVTSLLAGSNATAAGGIYQKDGGVTATAADGTNAGITLGNAAGAYGYYKISGGTLTANRLTIAGNGFAGATGVFEQTGGSTLINTWTIPTQSGGTNALLDISAGTFTAGTNFAMSHGSGNYAMTNARGTGVLARTLASTGSYAILNNNAGNSNNIAILNVGAGGIIRTNAGGITLANPTSGTNNLGLINFNNGTIITNAASGTLVGVTSAGLNAQSGAYIYSGGLTVDTNGLNSTITAALLAPTGEGVSTIAVTSGGSGYIGAPLIKITGGTGVGATAVANMVDDGTGNGTFSIGSITITNPGTGYVNTDTLTLAFGDNTSVYTTQAVLGAVAFNGGNTSGGLVKAGNGTLTLTGANTYTGGTTINLGTVALGAADVLANTGNVTVNGGTFDTATFNDTVATVSLQSGSITGSTGVLTSTANFDLQSGVVNFTGTGGLGGSVNVNKTTSGTVTLTSNGLGSFANVVNVTAGTLAFSTAAQLGNAAATNTLTVNGGTLSYTGVGPVSLAANQVVTVGTSHGTLNATQSTGTITLAGGISGSSTGNLIKTGSGTVVIPGTSSWNSGGSSVTVSDGTLQAGFGTSGIAALTVGATGNMNLTNNAAEILTLGATAGALTISGGARFAFELGAGNANSALSIGDQIIVGTGGSALTSGGIITLDFINLGGALTAGTFNLFSDLNGGGGLLTGGITFALGTAPGGFNYTINQTANLVSLSVVNFVPIYWRGGADTSWSTLGAAPANWTTDVAGNTDALTVPGAADTVIFSSNPVAGAAVTTALDGNFKIDGLQFRDNGNVVPVTSVIINQGTSGTLTLAPSSTSGGIEVGTNAGAVTIAAPVVANGDIVTTQTWNVVGGGVNGSSLTISGNLTITDLITKTGAGSLTLGGANSGAGGITLTGGTLNINSTTALGTGTFTIGSGTVIDASSASITNANANVQNWNGNFGFTGTNSLNLGTGAVTLGGNVAILASANTLTVGGIIDDGTSAFSFTKSGAGTLVLNGNNSYDGLTDLSAGTLTLGGDNSGAAGGVTMAASTVLNLGHAAALGTGTLTINGGTLDNTSGSAMTSSTNNLQNWNGSFTFVGSNSLNFGTGAVTLGATTTITTTASTLTAGAVSDGSSNFGITKDGAGTLVLGGVSAYDGATVINQGTLRFASGIQTLSSVTNMLTFGTAAGSSNIGTLDLSAASATFGGATLVQTNSVSANTITIGSGQTLRLNGAVTVGYNSAATSTTKLTVSGDGTLTIGAVGAATNANFLIGNGTTTNISNAGTVDMSGLATFYANLGTGTFRVGQGTNAGGTGTAGSTLILAANSTITATTITSDSPDNTVTQAIKLGSGTNVFNANTIVIGGAANRAVGTLDFNDVTGTLQVRALNTTGRAVMDVQNGNSGTGSSISGSVNLIGHSADLLLSTLTIGARSAGTTANGTGTFAFDTGILDATTINLAARTGTTLTTGSLTGNLNLGGGTVTVGTLTMSTNNVNFNTTTGSGDATSTLTISGSGTTNITTLTMGTLAVTNTSTLTSGSSDTTATVNVTGGTTTVGTLTMGSNASAATTVTANTATSSLNISAGSVSVTNNLTMGQATLRAGNTATATITITGTGALTVGGNIQYTDAALGTENNTITLNGGILDMTNGNIGGAGGTGAGAGIITFNAQSGTLRNVAQINGGATFNKTTTGTLVLDTANNYTGATTVTAGVLAISHGGALGGTTNGTSVAAGGTLAMSGNITVTGESLSLAAGAGGNATLSNQSGANTWTGNLTVDTGSDATNRALLNSDAGKLTVSGNVNLSSGTQDFVLRGDGNGEISGQITGSQRLFKSSVGTGTWILSGDNSATFTGRTSVSNGAIQVASESNLGATPGSFVANQLTLGGGSTNGKLKTTASMALSANRGVTIGAGGGTFDTADATTLAVNGVVTGGGAITKEGTGTVLFNAVNTNTGTTTVNAGTLGGMGTVGGDLIVASGGTLAPGVGGAGQLTLTGALSLNTGGSLLMELGGVTYNDADTVRAYFNTNGNLSGLTVLGAYENYQVGVTQHDSLLINGSSAPVINGTFKFGSLINGYTPHYGDIFDLIDWTAAGNIAGTPTFDFSSVSLTGLAFNTDLFASNGIVVVVPEPSRVLFLMLGLLGLMLRRRRW